MSDLHVIVGLGVSGLSCVRYLHAQSIPVAVIDTRLHPPYLDLLQKTHPGIPVSLGKLDTNLLHAAAKIIVSPGISLREPELSLQIEQGKPVIGDVELFAQVVKAPVIAITGTNAKSTVTTLVGMMADEAGFKVQVGGNLGVPVLDLLLANPKTDLFVLELSSFQLETTSSLKPQVATILNITPDHMDRYHTLEEYSQAKHRIYANCHTAVCNRDDMLSQCSDTRVKRKLFFTLDTPERHEFGLLNQSNRTYLAHYDTPLLDVAELPVNGKHYQANALAALAIGYSFGFPLVAMINVLKSFKGLPHRCQLIRERLSVQWYNDSKGTNVGATLAAIEGLGSEIQGKLVLIAGGLGKNADFSPLVPAIAKYTRHLVLIGEAANELAKLIGDTVPVSFAINMEQAVEQAARAAKPNDAVLLSPACASYDMFKNYEHRGQVFMEAVRSLN